MKTPKMTKAQKQDVNDDGLCHSGGGGNNEL